MLGVTLGKGGREGLRGGRADVAPGPHPSALTALPSALCPLSIPTMLSVHSEQLHKTGFPTVHAVVLLEGTMNLTGETQPLVEQLMMVKRMQVGGRGGFSVPTASWPWRAGGRSLLIFPGRYRVSPALWQIMDPHRGGSVWWNGSAISPAVPGSRSGVREVSMLPGSDLPDPQGSGDWSGMGHPLLPHPWVFPQHIPTPLFVLEIWKACFVGLIESPEGTGELKWTAFTFLKVPELWEPQRASVGMVLRRVGTPLDLCPRFLPSSFIPSLPGPHYPKAPRLFCPLRRPLLCLGTQVP